MYFRGNGTMIWKTGETYTGQWDKGLRSGFGVLTFNKVSFAFFLLYNNIINLKPAVVAERSKALCNNSQLIYGMP